MNDMTYDDFKNLLKTGASKFEGCERNELKMTAISPIRIHKPDSCHGWGIEFNYERPSGMLMRRTLWSLCGRQ